MDGGQITGEPVRQVDIGDRSSLGAETLRDVSERAPEAVSGKNQALACDDACRDSGPPAGPPGESCVEHIDMHDSMENQASV